MNKSICFILSMVLFFGGFFCAAQNQNKTEGPVLFTDRDYCVSGDTLWFKVFLPESKEDLGNVIRVQIDNVHGNVIAGVAIKYAENHADGYIHIPDSLSTGQYFITAFLTAQKQLPHVVHTSRSVMVYNRFDENVQRLEIAGQDLERFNSMQKSPVSMNTLKNEYRTREKVKVNLEIKKGVVVDFATVRASLVDPLARDITEYFSFSTDDLDEKEAGFVEKDGFLLSGKVFDENGQTQQGVLVILSVGTEPPYLDYFFTGENGDFHFFLKNASGKVRIVLQVISENQKEFQVQLENHSLSRPKVWQTASKFPGIEQTDFINTAIQSSFVHRLFYPSLPGLDAVYRFPQRFPVPFYGTDAERVIPSEFFELNDFREISREILPGVQFREKENEISIRLINNRLKNLFEKEPLRLINGIPVFKNELLAGLKPVDIDYIDIVKEERIFGDLVLQGVLSVVLHDKSNSWLAQQPNVFQFDIEMIQQYKPPGYFEKSAGSASQPDFRQVYFWASFGLDLHREFEFDLSDRKGEVAIEITGYTKEKEFFKSSKIISVR